MKNKKQKTKAGRKLVSLFLTAAMFFTLQGVPTLAETAGAAPVKGSEMAGENADAAVNAESAGKAEAVDRTGETREMPKNPVHNCTREDDGTDTTTWSYVYFGSYPQTEVTGDSLTAAITGAVYDAGGDAWVNGIKYRRISKSDTNNTDDYFGNSTYRYFKWERIKWRVLNVNNSTMFVMADKGLDCKDYHDPGSSITWENCTLRNWLNNDFYGTAFGSGEQGAIVAQTVANEDNPYYNTVGGNDTRDKVYLLSLSEVMNPDYGFCEDYSTCSVSRRVKASDYAHARGAYAGNCWWWLRSPGNYAYRAAHVGSSGIVLRNGDDVNLTNAACVPALHINLSSDLWSMADDGTSGEGGGGGTGTDPTPNDSSIQCGSSCSVETGRTAFVITKAYGESKENLTEMTESATWKSQDTSIATVEDAGFILPLSPDVYKTENGTCEIWSGTGFLSVKGISEGTTTITGTASDGSTAVCKVTVSAQEKESGIGNGGSLTLGEDAKGAAGGDSGSFFPATWSLKSTVFPVEISKTESEDGSFTIKGSIGIGKSDLLKDDAKWNKFKNNVSDAQKYTGRVDCLNSYRKTWGVKSLTAVSTDKFKVLPKLSVMGYFENSYDRNGNLISQTGKLAADAKWSGSISWQFVTPIGPLYLNLEGSGKLSGKIGPKYDYNTKKVSIADGSLTLTPGIALEGGYGIDKVATIGAQGELSIPITLIPATKGEFQAKASVHVKLVFVIDWKHELASYQTTLWDTTKKKTGKGAAGWGTSELEGTLSAMDTSFAVYESGWNGTGLQRKPARKRSVSADTERILQDGLFPSSLPMMAEIDGKQVMVFQAYDASKDTLNSSALKYSVMENGVWSDPQSVWDQGGSDLFADLKVVNNKLVLVWQKSKTAVVGNLDADVSGTMREIAEKSEVCFAEFDPALNMFTSQTYVTDNETCDMMPQVFDAGESIGLAWVRNGSADLMQTEGTNEIYTALWDGSFFGEEKLLARSPGTVENFAAYQDGEEIKAVYSGQIGGDEKATAVFDEHNQTPEAFGECICSSEDGAISDMHYADGKISFLLNGKLYSYHVGDQTMDSFSAGESTFGNTAQYCTNGEKSGYVWSIYDEDTKTGRIMASMASEEGYSEPVTLYEKQGVMWRHISPALDTDGNWKFAVNAMQTEDAGSDHHALYYIEKESDSRIELAGASVHEGDVADGLTGIDYFVTNKGDTPIHSLTVEITLADGSVITKEIPVTIQPGESAAETAYVDLSGVDSAQDVSISIYVKGQTDKEDCTVTDSVGLSDVAVAGTLKETGGNVVVTADLSNDSGMDADTTLRLYSDETQTKELCAAQTAVITANGREQLQMTVKKADIAYNKNDAAYLTLKAEVKDGDYNEDNNVSYVILYKEKPNPEKGTGQTNTDAGKASPKSTSIKGKIKAKSRGFLVKWNRQTDITGYQIQYSTNKKFRKKGTKIKTVTKPSATKLTVKKLKPQKKYYIRIRTYKTVNGTSYYSGWSKKKSVKTK